MDVKRIGEGKGMSALTATEIIATRLLSWTYIREEDGSKLYTHPTGSSQYVGGDLDGTGAGQINGADWPDLENWNDIRRMEDALAERWLLGAYLSKIYVDENAEWYANYGHSPTLLFAAYYALRATPAQRVAAAIRVIEEEGL